VTFKLEDIKKDLKTKTKTKTQRWIGEGNKKQTKTKKMDLLLFATLWLYCLASLQPNCWAGGVGSGVKTPSASSATKFSMASSIFAMSDLINNNDDDDIEVTKETEECRVKNLKQQQKMAMAKLDAHRCLIRDVVVQVPAPATIIANFIHPSHVVVQRCTGKKNNLT
jgi:hypothetical protein